MHEAQDRTEYSALALQSSLLQMSLAAWPRRGKTLLEVNCGEGLFLPLLWEYGFDVTGTELNPDLRAKAHENSGHKAEIEAAADDYLPYDNDAFDWVVLHAGAKDSVGNLEAAAREALRVAAGGLAVIFWNKTSPAYAIHRLFGRKTFWVEPSYGWWSVWRMLKSFRAGRLSSFTTLAGPPLLWGKKHCQTFLCHSLLRFLPFGAWGILRLDITPPGFVTPLPLRTDQGGLRQPATAMECSQRNSQTVSCHNREKTV